MEIQVGRNGVVECVDNWRGLHTNGVYIPIRFNAQQHFHGQSKPCHASRVWEADGSTRELVGHLPHNPPTGLLCPLLTIVYLIPSTPLPTTPQGVGEMIAPRLIEILAKVDTSLNRVRVLNFERTAVMQHAPFRSKVSLLKCHCEPFEREADKGRALRS